MGSPALQLAWWTLYRKSSFGYRQHACSYNFLINSAELLWTHLWQIFSCFTLIKPCAEMGTEHVLTSYLSALNAIPCPLGVCKFLIFFLTWNLVSFHRVNSFWRTEWKKLVHFLNPQLGIKLLHDTLLHFSPPSLSMQRCEVAIASHSLLLHYPQSNLTIARGLPQEEESLVSSPGTC